MTVQDAPEAKAHQDAKAFKVKDTGHNEHGAALDRIRADASNYTNVKDARKYWDALSKDAGKGILNDFQIEYGKGHHVTSVSDKDGHSLYNPYGESHDQSFTKPLAAGGGPYDALHKQNPNWDNAKLKEESGKLVKAMHGRAFKEGDQFRKNEDGSWTVHSAGRDEHGHLAKDGSFKESTIGPNGEQLGSLSNKPDGKGGFTESRFNERGEPIGATQHEDLGNGLSRDTELNVDGSKKSVREDLPEGKEKTASQFYPNGQAKSERVADKANPKNYTDTRFDETGKPTGSTQHEDLGNGQSRETELNADGTKKSVSEDLPEGKEKTATEFYPNGQAKSEHVADKSNPKNYTDTRFDETGKPTGATQHEDLGDGRSRETELNADGTKKSVREDLPEGKERTASEFYPNGQAKSEHVADKTNPNNYTDTSFDETGKRTGATQHEDLGDGRSRETELNADGTKKSVREDLPENNEKTASEFYPNGQAKSERVADKDNPKNYTDTRFDEQGKRTGATQHEDLGDGRSRETELNADGTKNSVREDLPENREKTASEFYPNGQPKSERIADKANPKNYTDTRFDDTGKRTGATQHEDLGDGRSRETELNADGSKKSVREDLPENKEKTASEFYPNGQAKSERVADKDNPNNYVDTRFDEAGNAAGSTRHEDLGNGLSRETELNADGTKKSVREDLPEGKEKTASEFYPNGQAKMERTARKGDTQNYSDQMLDQSGALTRTEEIKNGKLYHYFGGGYDVTIAQ